MPLSDGPYFTATISALRLPPDEERGARANAENIVTEIIKSYETNISKGHVGEGSSGIARGFTTTARGHVLTGLVYGRIQSGKTRAMIASTAMAFDNGFRIVLVLTSNINDLVAQTHFDFVAGLPNVMVYTKDDELDREKPHAKQYLSDVNSRILIVCSKGATSLTNVADFLRGVEARLYPAIVFDDEGDQASLDTNVRKRSLTGVAVAASSINNLIQKELRPKIPCHVYVSVTGTPQAVLLQSAESSNRPSFITLLPPGDSYVGGDFFFSTDEPEENAHNLIRIVERDEKAKLLENTHPIPEGLRRAILFYLLSSAALIKKTGVPKHGKGYSFLCHPSLKNKEQAVARERIDSFLTEVTAALLKSDGNGKEISRELNEEYQNLKKGLAAHVPSVEELSKAIVTNLRTRKILVINATTKRQGIAYGPELNFLIGGNTLGRGIAIRDLLVTYYIRESKISQIDTMHQHARMFGYRKDTLPHTRLFIPRHLYYRFRDIHRSDEDLRKYIDKYKQDPETFPIELSCDLRPTRTSVLNVNTTDTLEPGKQVYPNYMALPQSPKAYANVERQLVAHFGQGSTMDANGASGKMISVTDAVNLIKPIKTKSQNTWSDKTIGAVIRKVAGELGGQIKLKYRRADRTVGEGGFISTGALSGIAYEKARKENVPTLWVLAIETTDESFCGGGKKFMYPTFVIPDKLEKLFIFSRG